MSSRCCYFLRNVAPGVALDTSKSGESDLLYGELGGSALGTIEAILSQTYRPILDNYDQWGRVDETQKSDFINEVKSFIGNISESLNVLSTGLELKSPDPRYIKTIDPKTQRITYPTEAYESFEVLLGEWCDEIEAFMERPLHPVDTEDVGPKWELEHWRSRMQKLTSITEQLKRPDCRHIINILSLLTKNNADMSKQNLINLLRRWKQIDLNITELANEAKDNVKYLFTLQRFIEPLYFGTPESVAETLPALINSIKMIHTISRYYNTPERLSNLFSRITDQMIINCRKYITNDSNSDIVWDLPIQTLVQKCEVCINLNNIYQEQYQITKTKLELTPKNNQFNNFNELHMFGKYDLFGRRLSKLIEMFTTIDQFNSLPMNKLDGLNTIIIQFNNIIKDFKLKRHDLLEYYSHKFDRDYVEFNAKIIDLEVLLQNFINKSFLNITSIEHSLLLLKKFQNILQRESLKSDLDSQLNVIFQNYGR